MFELNRRLLFVAALAVPLDAQVDFDALDREVTLRLDDAGRLMLAPDPSAGGDTDAATTLVDPMFGMTLANGGIFGWLALVYQGDCDFASMADAGAILRRLGLADDPSLIQQLANRSTEPHHRLLRLLAIRHVQDRELRAAIPVLERELELGIVEPHAERAAREALAALRGVAWETSQPASIPIAKLASHLPPEPDMVVFVDAARLPAGRPLLRWGRELGLGMTKAAIRKAGDTVSTSAWAAAVQLAEGMAALPYEAARQYGNHRIARGLCAVQFGDDGTPDLTLAIHGVFDIAAMRRGLSATDLKLAGDGERIEIADDAEQFVFTPSLAVASLRDSIACDAEQAAALVARVAPDDAPIAVWFRDDAELPGLPPQLNDLGIPRRIALWLPRGTDTELRLRLTLRTKVAAGTFAGLLTSAPRTFELWLEQEPDAEGLRPLVELLEQLKVERDGLDVTATLSLRGLDVAALLTAIVRMG